MRFDLLDQGPGAYRAHENALMLVKDGFGHGGLLQSLGTRLFDQP